MDWNSEEAHTGNHLHLYDNWKLTPGIWRLASLLQLLCGVRRVVDSMYMIGSKWCLCGAATFREEQFRRLLSLKAQRVRSRGECKLFSELMFLPVLSRSTFWDAVGTIWSLIHTYFTKRNMPACCMELTVASLEPTHQVTQFHEPRAKG